MSNWLQKFQAWFSLTAFLLSFAAMMFLVIFPIPEANREMASNLQGFLQGSMCMSAINFLLGGNPLNQFKKPAENKVAPIGSVTVPEQTLDVEATDKPE